MIGDVRDRALPKTMKMIVRYGGMRSTLPYRLAFFRTIEKIDVMCNIGRGRLAFNCLWDTLMDGQRKYLDLVGAM